MTWQSTIDASMSASAGNCREQPQDNCKSPAAHRLASPVASYPSEQTRDALLRRSTVTPESTAAQHAAVQQPCRGHAAILQQAQHPQQWQQQGFEGQIPGLAQPQVASRTLHLSSHNPRRPGSATALPQQLLPAECPKVTAPPAAATGQLDAEPADTVIATAVQAPAAPAASAGGRDGTRMQSGKRAASALDTVLMQQGMALEPLLPTPTNINPILVPGADFLQFVRVQQWVSSQLGIQVPLLNGMFVLVPSTVLQHPLPEQLQDVCRNSNSSSGRPSSSRGALCSAFAAAIPCRLRQVLSVEVSAAVDPADATVLLVGGDRVRARAVKADVLADVQDYQYLCCELAHMQQQRQMCQLQVLDIAHMAWRLKVACELEDVMRAQQELSQLAAVRHGAGQHTSTAVGADMGLLGRILQQLPPSDWVGGQILQYVELNPIVWPDCPEQPWQLLSKLQYSQLLRDAAEAWQHYVQQKLAGQQPQPVTDFVPWLPICADEEQQQQQQQAQQGMQDAEAAGGRARRSRSPSDVQMHRTRSNSPSCSRSSGGAARGRSSSRRGDTSGQNSSSDTDDSASSSSHTMSRGQHRSRTYSPSIKDERRRGCSKSQSSGKGTPCRSRSRSPFDLAITRSGTSRCFRGSVAQAALLACLREKPRAWWFNPTDPCSQYMEIKVQKFLQQLAVKLTEWSGPPPPPGQAPYFMTFDQVFRPTSGVKLSYDVTRHYGSIQKFVQARPELQWVRVPEGSQRMLIMQPMYHALLLARAQLSAAAPGRSLVTLQQQESQHHQHHQQQQEQQVTGWPEYLADQQQQLQLQAAVANAAAAVARTAAAGVSTDDGGCGACCNQLNEPDQLGSKEWESRNNRDVSSQGRSRSRSYSRRRRQSRVHSNSRSRSRSRDDSSRSSSRSGSGSPGRRRGGRGKDSQDLAWWAKPGPYWGSSNAGTPAQYTFDIEAKVQEWLKQLAGLLQPPNLSTDPPSRIKLEHLKHKLPVPASIVQHFGSIRRFITATPALQWADTDLHHRNHVALVPSQHVKLLEAVQNFLEHAG